ncbi:Ras family GTPase [Indivirus ILV1]|uniref:Ras family GTPase n=1 Tax=Indivirus ILV1 TaxID=1977633 RepID=A0A1V0SEB6_9VIRU|nr:Ras family GTPase [Indivirus ILV1]
MSNFNYIYKVIVVGDSGVGKSNIVNRFINNTFTNDAKSTIGIDFQVKTLDLGPETIKIQIWDTAGQERFRSIHRSYYKYSSGIIIVFDLTNRQSFEHIEKWIEEIEKSVDNNLKNIKFLLVGNKSDLVEKRKVYDNDIKTLYGKFDFVYVETSAKNNIGIKYGFYELAKKIHEDKNYLCKIKNYDNVLLFDEESEIIDSNKSYCC